jgi:hypothetical protein
MYDVVIVHPAHHRPDMTPDCSFHQQLDTCCCSNDSPLTMLVSEEVVCNLSSVNMLLYCSTVGVLLSQAMGLVPLQDTVNFAIAPDEATT